MKLDTSPIEDDQGLILEIKQQVIPDEFSLFRLDPDGSHKIQRKRLLYYKHKLQEVVTAVEGLLSINYDATPPIFESHRIVANLYPEDQKEKEWLKEEGVVTGFGEMGPPERYPKYSLRKNLFEDLGAVKENIPALSYYVQGVRAEDRYDQETAFTNYFKIIEGYFGDGTSAVEKALLNNCIELQRVLSADNESKEIVERIMNLLGLPSKSHENYEGFIKDIVMLRHKLMHFSKKYSSYHYNPSLRFELRMLNMILRSACRAMVSKNIYNDID